VRSVAHGEVRYGEIFSVCFGRAGRFLSPIAPVGVERKYGTCAVEPQFGGPWDEISFWWFRMKQRPHIVVIGSGAGGYGAAVRAAQLGAQVTVIEKDSIGGVCLHRGCIPSKALVASVNLLRKILDASTFGIDLSGEVTVDMKRMVARKNRIVREQVDAIISLFKALGVDSIAGRGRLTGPKTIEVTDVQGGVRTLSADKIILATGSRPTEFGLLPFDRKHILSTDEALDIEKIPRRIAIIGAGVSGCEFAFIFRGLGSDFTLIEMDERALVSEDEEISGLLERSMRNSAIDLRVRTRVAGATIFDQKIRLRLESGESFEVDKALVTIGRTLNTDGLGLADAGVEVGRQGRVLVNLKMESSVPGIFAVGDIAGSWMLAHVAAVEGRVAAESAAGLPSEMDYSVIPAGIFTIPEIGRVGITEESALDQGLNIRVSRYQFRSVRLT
jgi:dihydrolipoamide dehydrogenase